MPTGQRPLVRRRLRLELRQERERARKSQAEVAKKMDWSLSKIIRLEAGQVGISTNDLKALLDLYSVDGEERRAFLIGLARAARMQSTWWSAYRDVLPSSDYADFLGYETDASILTGYFGPLIPGLLQTEEYAREVISLGGPLKLTEEEVDRLVEVRMARKQYVLDRDDNPTLNAIVDEAALHRMIGGGEVMNEQLSSVAEVGALSNIVVRVIPYSAGAHPGLRGTFLIMEFADPADAPVLQLDTAPRDVFLREEPDQLEIYREAFRQMERVALSEEESRDVILAAADRAMEVAEHGE